jgi:hypothetical protein
MVSLEFFIDIILAYYECMNEPSDTTVDVVNIYNINVCVRRFIHTFVILIRHNGMDPIDFKIIILPAALWPCGRLGLLTEMNNRNISLRGGSKGGRCVGLTTLLPSYVRCILFDGENTSFDAILVIDINSTNSPPIMFTMYKGADKSLARPTS